MADTQATPSIAASLAGNYRPDSNLKSSKRVMTLEKIPGLENKTTASLIDRKLFEGETKLVAVLDDQFALWSVHYTDGILPEALKQRFTSFTKLYDYCSKYFKTRGIRIANVID